MCEAEGCAAAAAAGSGPQTRDTQHGRTLGLAANPARRAQDPVIEPEGNRYERTAIERWLTTNDTSPMTGAALKGTDVVPNHALRNAIIPVVSLSAVQLGFMLGGSIVIETIFSMHGIGRLAWQSIQRSDFEMMQAIVLTIACFYIVLTFLADVLNAFLDPKIRVH